MQGRQTQFYIEFLYGFLFIAGFALLMFQFDPRVAAFEGGLVIGYILRVWEKMSIYERIIEERVSEAAESQVEAELDEQVPEEVQTELQEQVPAEVETELDDQVQAQVTDELEEQVEAQVSDEVETELDDRLDDRLDEDSRARTEAAESATTDTGSSTE
ncbi:putative membrane protein [Halorhabdus sp. SVX81]|nr:putative membrane protein [Halorhabdus sp. SVX81]